MTKKIKAVYPGSFDPITNGHIDIIKRAARLFDVVIVAITKNYEKESTFSIHERKLLVESTLRGLPPNKVRVDTFDELLVHYLKRVGASVVIRGLRFVSDFEYEFQMALTNRNLYPEMETVFLMPDEKHSYLSSSMVKEIASLGGNIEKFVPPNVAQALKKKLTLGYKSQGHHEGP